MGTSKFGVRNISRAICREADVLYMQVIGIGGGNTNRKRRAFSGEARGKSRAA